MRIALAQILSGAEPQANLELVADWTTRAAEQGAALVVFPEATMRCFGRNLVEVAEPLDGPWATGVRTVAADAGVTVAVGMFTPVEPAGPRGGRVRNTLLVTGPDVDAAYDKIHLYDAYGFAESDTVAPGDKPLVLDVAGVSVGFTTCYDVRFPGLYTALADAGASIVCVAASWGAGPGKVEQWELLVRARALDATTFVAACGQADPGTVGVAATGTAPTGVGHSLLVGPDGTVRAHLGAEPGLLVVDVDLDEVGRVRRSIPVLSNRRF